MLRMSHISMIDAQYSTEPLQAILVSKIYNLFPPIPEEQTYKLSIYLFLFSPNRVLCDSGIIFTST